MFFSTFKSKSGKKRDVENKNSVSILLNTDKQFARDVDNDNDDDVAGEGEAALAELSEPANIIVQLNIDSYSHSPISDVT